MRLAELCARLAALQEESITASQSIQLLVADRSIASSELSSGASSLAEIIRRKSGAAIGDYVASAEAAGLAPKTLRFLAAELGQRDPRTQAGWLVAAEFSFVIVVAFTYSVFVFPSYQSLFEDFHTDLPAVTRVMITLFSSASPFLWGLLLIWIVAFMWRTAPVALGPMTSVLDRLVLALPEVGEALRTRNADALAGWLGHVGPADRQTADLALDAAIEYGGHGVTARACRRLRALVDQAPTLQEALGRSLDFDSQINAVVAAAKADANMDLAAVLRARWRAAEMIKSSWSIRIVVLAQLFVGVLVALLVAALYLPIFKVGAFF